MGSVALLAHEDDEALNIAAGALEQSFLECSALRPIEIWQHICGVAIFGTNSLQILVRHLSADFKRDNMAILG